MDSLLVEHQRGEFAGLFIRRQFGIVGARPRVADVTEIIL
jgi:hypothetical protein